MLVEDEPQSFQSIPEELQERVIKGHVFMESKRRANCCSKFTYWYSNNLVDAVRMNNGKMHERMIEDMNSDPNRDQKLLLRFQERLNASFESWKKANPGQDASNEWYGFTKSAIWSTVGCQFLMVAFVALIAEMFTLGSLFLIRYLA